jgi:hypothetical protein
VKTIQYLIYTCFIVILVGGVGTIVGLITHAQAARLPFMYVLVGGLGLFVLTLVVALTLGAYLYFFTDRKSLSYFSSRKP